MRATRTVGKMREDCKGFLEDYTGVMLTEDFDKIVRIEYLWFWEEKEEIFINKKREAEQESKHLWKAFVWLRGGADRFKNILYLHTPLGNILLEGTIKREHRDKTTISTQVIRMPFFGKRVGELIAKQILLTYPYHMFLKASDNDVDIKTFEEEVVSRLERYYVKVISDTFMKIQQKRGWDLRVREEGVFQDLYKEVYDLLESSFSKLAEETSWSQWW